MTNSRIRVHLSREVSRAARRFRTGVSLHGHTQHSKENLGFISGYVDAVPMVAELIKGPLQQYEADHGRKLDFARAYWTAPMSEQQAYELERQQIEHSLGLRGMISLTDHDDIEAPLSLRAAQCRQKIPISLEWSLPFGPTWFHIGVHNLPPEGARQWMTALSAYTDRPEEEQLGPLLEGLSRIPSVLLVFNHPAWDMFSIGTERFSQLLDSFTTRHGRWLHALEVNGLRSWRENQYVMRVAEDRGYPVVSGGDRHGWEPNAVLNLTSAGDFSEFVAEVREGLSEIAIMPQYHDPLGFRMMQVAWDIMGHYPEHHAGKTHWTDRIYFECEDSVVRPLAKSWRRPGGPPVFRHVNWVMGLLGRSPIREAVKVAFSDGERSML